MNNLKVLRWVAGFAFVVGLLFNAGAVHAQSAAQKKAAKEYFEQARRLYDVGKYQEAIEAYQKAYLNVEDPVFLYNIAQSHRLNNQPEDAIRFYKNYLRRSPEAANRGEVEKKMEDLQKEIDDKAKGLNKPPTQPTVEPVTPAVSTPPPVQPAPVSNTLPPPVVIDAPIQPPSENNSWRTTGIVLAGVGGVLFVTSVITGALANKAAKDVEKGPVFDPDVESRGQTLNKVAITTGLLGLAAGITGGVFLWMDGGSSSSNPEPAPRVAFAPVIGGNYTGAEAMFRF